MNRRVLRGLETLAYWLLLLLLCFLLAGSGTSTVKFRDPADTKDRVTATVVDGNRTAVTLNAS